MGRNWWDQIAIEQSQYWRFRPVIKPEQWALFEKEKTIMPMDMKDPEIAKRFSELFIKKKSELALVDMSSETLLDHIKNLEAALELLIFESRAEIQGARDFLEEKLKTQSKQEIESIRARDKASKYRPSLNQLEESEKQARKAATNSKSASVNALMEKYNIKDRKVADCVLGFIKLGMTEEAALRTAGI
jgi:hypothetical protein